MQEKGLRKTELTQVEVIKGGALLSALWNALQSTVSLSLPKQVEFWASTGGDVRDFSEGPKDSNDGES